MAQFATAAELGTRLGVTLTGPEQARAASLLELASGLIQRAARQAIEQVVNDTLIVRASAEPTIRLPERPVSAVVALTLDGTQLGEDDWRLDGDELTYRAGWGWPLGSAVAVTYDHGYEAIPDAIRAVCLEAVVRVWVNPGSVMTERYGSEAVAYAQEVARGLMLNADERRAVREAVRRGSESLSIR